MALEIEGGEIIYETKEMMSRWNKYIKNINDWLNRSKEEETEVEHEDLVIKGEKVFDILESEIGTWIKEMKNGKATWSDEMPVDILKAMQVSGKEITVNLCNNIYNNGKLSRDFIKNIMIPIPKKKKTEIRLKKTGQILLWDIVPKYFLEQ